MSLILKHCVFIDEKETNIPFSIYVNVYAPGGAINIYNRNIIDKTCHYSDWIFASVPIWNRTELMY